ncbi:phospholipase D-like domain-containing protein [bacterium]|nr:phospholipase D-like domain-containing protein [bacterium]
MDVVNFPGTGFLGTGWFVDNDVVVTNRHVASLIAKWDGRRFAFNRGIAGRTLQSSLCNAHEFDDLDPDSNRIFKVKEVLYIEPESKPYDIAFLRVERRTTGSNLPFIPVTATDVPVDVPVCVIGYPARAPKSIIPDQQLMQDLYLGRFDIKRAAPGFTTGMERGSSTHDCTTLGGNSGSVVINLATGQAVGLHFAGLYKENNFAVPASILTNYIRGKKWNQPYEIESHKPSKPASQSQTSLTQQPGIVASGPGSVSMTIPLTITVNLGTPSMGLSQATMSSTAVTDMAQVERAVLDYWDARPDGVLAVRVGYFDDGERIGDQPCIAVSVLPESLSIFESKAPNDFHGIPIRYLAADVDEQLQTTPLVESVESISYDDNARTGEKFSFAPVNENMDIILHVGPEYSWDVLQKFLQGANGKMVSAMYEFHAPHIKDAIEQRLENGAELTLVLDNATFSKVKDEEFDRVQVFDDWANRFDFNRIVAPEGISGLISDSYHIKVTVRDDDTFWLSSGNWKLGSSQPIITEEQRENATEVDLPGNREWHVVIHNQTLANRYRNHILQDFKRSKELGGNLESRSLLDEIFVDVPLELEAIAFERKPPSQILKPKTISRQVKVRPLLTPDQEGAVYSDAVLDLIRSARNSLLFQIPYIGMPSNPRQDRGFIDELIKALTQKLKTLDDARVILRVGGSKLSSPSHAAWYFKSKGVDIDERLRVIENHHTKGMIVDGKRMLLGSNNWSKPGVTLNRDASLIFEDEEIASYYAEAFEVDWLRANHIKPKRFIKQEVVVFEAVGTTPPPGYRRVRLSELLEDD